MVNSNQTVFNSVFRIFRILFILFLYCGLLFQNIYVVNGDLGPEDKYIYSGPLRGDNPNLYDENRRTDTNLLNDRNKEVNEIYMNKSLASLVTGTQIGSGSGIFEVYDSAILTQGTFVEVKDAHWRAHPEEHSTDYSINIPSDFTNFTGIFNLSDITALPDWRLLENKTPGTQILSNSFLEAAQEFDIFDSFVNLTKIALYIDMFDSLDNDDLKPTGNFLVYEDTGSGEPDMSKLAGKINLEDHSSLLGLSDGGSWSAPTNGWLEYTINPAINLAAGKYWFILNDTTSNGAVGYWGWRTQSDTGNPDIGNWLYKIFSHGSAWQIGDASDIIMMPQLLPVDSSLNELKYTNPKQLMFNYSTTIDHTSLSRFNYFSWNGTSDNVHTFETNTSVRFNFAFFVNVSYTNNPLSVSSYYKVDNSTNSYWNLTFSTSKIDTSYNVINHTTCILGVPMDWNGSKIFWNDSITPEYATMVNNLNITSDGKTIYQYEYGDTTIYINSSTLKENVSWNILFNATNYIVDFHLLSNGFPLEFPYSANITDIIELDFTLKEIGNVSYWIDYPNGINLLSNTNVNDTHLTFSQLWDINGTVDQTVNVNGTYTIQAFWENTEKTKVGTYTRSLDMYVNTSLVIQADTEVLIGQKFNVTVFYQSIHNYTNIQNAPIYCEANWTANTYMNQLPNDSYNASFITSGRNPGEIGHINISTQLRWFVNWTIQIRVSFVQNSSILVNATELVLEWKENITIQIHYNITGGSGIPAATITVNGDKDNFYSIDDIYYFSVNSTDYPGIGSYINLVIRANRSDYLTRIWYYNLTINAGETSLSASSRGLPVINDITIIPVIYAASTSDSITITLQYTHNLIGEVLNPPEPEVSGFIPVINVFQQANYSWSVTFDPNQIGLFELGIEFYSDNYQNQTFILKLNITQAGTEITSPAGESIIVFFTELNEFNLEVTNTYYSEFILGLSPEINNTILVQFRNTTNEDYWFIFNSTGLSIGTYSIHISFNDPLYLTSSIELQFNVTEMPTISLTEDPSNLIWDSSVMAEDTFTLTIVGFQTIRGDYITSLDLFELFLNGSKISESAYNLSTYQNGYIVSLNTTNIYFGHYIALIKLKTFGYINQSAELEFDLIGWHTTISVTIEPGENIIRGQEIRIIITLSPLSEFEGFGATIAELTIIGVNISFFVEIEYTNGTRILYEGLEQTDNDGRAVFVIGTSQTKAGVKFTNITILAHPSTNRLSALKMFSEAELDRYSIIPPVVNIFEVIIIVVTVIVSFILIIGLVVGTTRTMRRRRARKRSEVQRQDMKIEQGFEDIKSIRLIIARHESGLQFYSEKTIADISTDTDALSGMSAALSSFMEEVSESMSRKSAENRKDSIEVMSREGLHLLVWHGNYSSLIIISEVRLPGYFRDRLQSLGRDLEMKFVSDLQNFYSSDQIPSSVVKKMVRKYIPLHYFSAFVLNEGVLTLESIKLGRKEKKMLKMMKEIQFEKEGVNFFFSEQIISHLSKSFKRSEAIAFLNQAIEWNLLVEASQEDIIGIGLR